MPCHPAAAGFLLWEMSTPFLHLRWFLFKVGREGTQAYALNALLGMLVFFGCRNFWGVYLTWRFWTASAAALAAGDPSLNANVIFFYRVRRWARHGHLAGNWWCAKHEGAQPNVMGAQSNVMGASQT